MNVALKKMFDSYVIFSAIFDVNGVKTTLEIGGAEYILSNISEMIEDTVFV